MHIHLKKRNYAQILNRIKKALSRVSKIETLAYMETPGELYPIQKIKIGQGKYKRVLISAGIHGDEPAGVESICSFLESGKYKSYLNDWEFTILPCINPYGFEYNTRENYDGKDLNRLFKEDAPPLEVKLVQSIFKLSRFDLTLELHEDSDSNGYYIYQKSNKPFGVELGYKILEAVKEIIPLNLNSYIDNTPAERGLIHRFKSIYEMDWWPMAGYALAMKSNHCFTLETPTNLPMVTRVNAHLNAINTALIEAVI